MYIGYAKEPVSYEARLFGQKELYIPGSGNAQPEDFQAVIRLLEAGMFPLDQAVSLVVSLEEARRHCVSGVRIRHGSGRLWCVWVEIHVF